MSAVADDNDSGTVFHHAPGHVRYPSEEHSIRPVLERLRRGESGEMAVMPAEPAPLPLEPARRAGGRKLIACSAVSALLSAGLGVLAIGWLAPGKTEPAGVESAQFAPKVVHTVAFQQPAPQASTATPEENVKPQPEPAVAQAPEPQRDQITPTELLAMWSGVPVEARADGAVATTNGTAVADVPSPGEAEAETPAAPRAWHRESATPRHTHAHRHVARRASAQHRPGAATDQAAAAQTSESNPLQLVLRSVFGGQSAATAQQPHAQQSGGTSVSPRPQVQNY